MIGALSVCVLSGAAAHVERFVSVSRLSVKAAVYVGSRQQNSSLHSGTNQQFLTDECTTALVLQIGISSSGIILSHRLHTVTCTGNCTSSAQQWPKIHARCQQEVTENYCTLGAFSLSAIKKIFKLFNLLQLGVQMNVSMCYILCERFSFQNVQMCRYDPSISFDSEHGRQHLKNLQTSTDN